MSVGGGFVAYGYFVMEGPSLVVYSDGRAVGEAQKVLTLDQTELSQLVGGVRRDLAGLPEKVDVDAEHVIADAGTTTFEVLQPEGLQHVSAYALSDMQGYPAKLIELRDRLEALTQRVLAEGQPYTSDRIRVVVEPRDDAGTGTYLPWPAAVPLPPPSAVGNGTRVADLTGAPAQAVAAGLPADWRSGPWPLLRLPDGSVAGVAWRYLTPEEPSREG